MALPRLDTIKDRVQVELNTSSLQAYYKFNETGAIASNSAQNLFHGDIINVQRIAGKVNTALLFQETRPSYVDISIAINATSTEATVFPDNKITLEAWYRFDRLDLDKECLVFGGKS